MVGLAWWVRGRVGRVWLPRIMGGGLYGTLGMGAYPNADAVIARRLAAAREEIGHVAEFDYVIINAQFETAIQDLLAIVRSQRLGGEKQLWRHQELLQKFN